jgi:hypothetical protein
MNYTYNTLKAALISFTEDNGTAFAAAIDTIIPLAEDVVLRDLDLTIFDIIASGVFVAGNPLLDKPTGCLATRDIIYVTGLGARNPLVQRDFSYARDYWPDETAQTGTPKFFSEYSDTQWWVAGTPNAGLTFTARIMKRPAGLTNAVQTTWLGTNVGDLVFYAALIVGTEYLKNDARLPTWLQEYTHRLEGAKNEFWMLRRQNYMPVTAIPAKVQEK